MQHESRNTTKGIPTKLIAGKSGAELSDKTKSGSPLSSNVDNAVDMMAYYYTPLCGHMPRSDGVREGGGGGERI